MYIQGVPHKVHIFLWYIGWPVQKKNVPQVLVFMLSEDDSRMYTGCPTEGAQIYVVLQTTFVVLVKSR